MNAKVHYLMSQKKRTSHITHCVVSIFFPPWLLVWLICVLKTTEHNRHIDDLIQLELIDK